MNSKAVEEFKQKLLGITEETHIALRRREKRQIVSLSPLLKR
jgi:hypothetical protein